MITPSSRNVPAYSLLPADPATAKRAGRWLLLGVAALGVAGIFAGLLANTRNPLFFTELVVHVDLSVLVWFLTMAGMLFTLALGGKAWGMVSDAAFYAACAGTALIAASAFSGGEPWRSNYIPVIYHPIFFLGLGLLLCSMLFMAVQIVLLRPCREPLRFGVYGAACILLLAALCFAWSVRSLPSDMTGQVYYEYGFWGGGHVLQFVHTQLMMVAWLWLADAAGVAALPRKAVIALFLIGPLAVLSAPVIYLLHDAATDEHREAFTRLMRDGGGIAPLILGGMLFLAPRKNGITGKLAFTCLLMSFLLFTAGGGLGYLINGSNLTVPAHYHGSIIGITIAFMGISYLLLPSLGFADVSRSLPARLQPIVYGGGMLCWMLGMALLGAQGVARKTPGSADGEGALLKFLKHGSDGLALIGGLLFVAIVLKAVFTHRKVPHGEES